MIQSISGRHLLEGTSAGLSWRSQYRVSKRCSFTTVFISGKSQKNSYDAKYEKRSEYGQTGNLFRPKNSPIRKICVTVRCRDDGLICKLC